MSEVGSPRSMQHVVKLPCGHPESAVVRADEGTAYCGACAAQAPRSMPDAITEIHETLVSALECDTEHLATEARLALSEVEAELTRLRRVEEVAKRLRQWDMLNGYIGGDGERHEPTADAPYWRAELDRVLQPNVAGKATDV